MNATRLVCLALLLGYSMAAGAQVATREVTLWVSDEGTYRFEGKTIKLAELRERLQALKRQEPQARVRVQGGPRVRYEHVGPAMQIVVEEGLAKTNAIVTEKAPPERRSDAPR